MANGRITNGPEEGVELDLAFPSAPTLHRRFEDRILNYSVKLRLDDDGQPVGYDVEYVDYDRVQETPPQREDRAEAAPRRKQAGRS